MTRIRSTSLVRAAVCAALALALAVRAVPADAQTVLDPDAPIMVTGGTIRGAVSAGNDEIVAFKGIPYAAPPVGDLRWRPPEPVVGLGRGARRLRERRDLHPERRPERDPG